MEESLLENFVCNLCLEAYTQPKSLPCLHSFCRECLLCYLQSKQQSAASSSSGLQFDSFSCPVCKQSVNIAWQKRITFGNLDVVVDSFHDNFHLVSLMQQLDIKPLTKYCGMCVNDDIQAKSDVWCQECNQALCQKCADTHRSLRITASHQLYTSASMRRKMVNSSDSPCSKHEDEPLKSFCMNCQMCTCYKCHMTIHKDCSNVLFLEDAVCNFTPEAKLMIEDLERQMESMVNLKDKITRQRNSYQKNRDKVATEIQKMTARLVEALQNNETQLLEELDKFHAEEVHKMETLENEVNNLLSTLSKTYQIFDSSFQGKNKTQFLNLFPAIRKETPNNETKVENLNLDMNQRKKIFRFDMNAKIHECLMQLEGLFWGKVTIATDTFSEVGSKAESTRTYNLPKMESSTSMDSINSVDSGTEMIDKPKSKRRRLLSWLCQCFPSHKQQLSPSVSQGKKEALIPDGVVFLSSGEALIIYWKSRSLKRFA